ncbi:hypothetical protein ACFL2A_02650 [Thermodesulfobacteriota bacterium]
MLRLCGDVDDGTLVEVRRKKTHNRRLKKLLGVYCVSDVGDGSFIDENGSS